MIYKLNQGMKHELRKWVTPLLVLLITAGFPAAAAYINREDLTLGPWPISTKDEPGVVLGDTTTESTDDQSPTTDNANPDQQPITQTSKPKSTIGARSQSSSQTNPLSIIQTPGEPTGGQGSGGGDCFCSQIPDPSAITPPSTDPSVVPVTPPAEEPLLNVQLEVPEVIEAEVIVNP